MGHPLGASGAIIIGTLLDELGKQYVITARAKGVAERRLLFRYPVRVAINPIVSTIGAGDAGTVRNGSIYVKLTDKSQRARDQMEIQRVMRGELEQVAGIVFSFAEPGNLDPRKKLQASVRGDDLETLKRNWSILQPGRPFPGNVILQADIDIDFRVIKKVMFSAAQAGYANVSFAVESTGAE